MIAEVAPFSSAEIGIKEFSFQDKGHRERTGIWCQTSGEEAKPGFRTAVGVIRCIETVAEIPGKSGKNLGQIDNRCLQAKLYKIPLARKRETWNTDYSLGSGTKLLLPSWLIGFQHEERETHNFIMLTVPSDPTTRGAPPRPNWSRLGFNPNSLLLFKNHPTFPARRFRAWCHSHPQSHFLSGVFIMTSVIVTSSPREREHLHSMCAPN